MTAYNLRQIANEIIGDRDAYGYEIRLAAGYLALLDENEALRAALTEARFRSGQVLNNWLTGGANVCLVCGELGQSLIHDDGCWVPMAQKVLGDAS